MTEIKLNLDDTLGDSLQTALQAADAIFRYDPAEVCITCSDEGRPVVVREVLEDGVTALTSSFRGEERVDVSLVGPVSAGDEVLVHAGMAIAKVKG